MTKRNSYDNSAIAKLDSADWPSIRPKLIKYAQAKENLLIKLNSDLVYIDIIKEAIARVYGCGENGKYRNWNSSKYPDLYKFLKFIIHDIVREEISRVTGYSTEQLFWGDDSNEERAATVSPYDKSDAHKYENPENLIIEMEGAKRLNEALDQIADKDEDLASLILCIYDEITKSAQIADETGFSIEKVYNLKRKLKRHLNWYVKESAIRDNPERRIV